MGRQWTMSVLGLYQYNNHLFEQMVFPTAFSEDQKETTINNILAECAELELLFPDYDFMHSMVGIWSKLEFPVWERIYNASLLEYNPIENYNRTEKETIESDKSETHSGEDIRKLSGTDGFSVTSSNTENHTGTDTNQNSITAYDSNTLHVHDKSELTHGESIASGGTTGTTANYGKIDGLTHGEKIINDDSVTRENHTSGNIGVTTSQQMLQQEVDIAPLLNVMKLITESFKERFCLLVY